VESGGQPEVSFQEGTRLAKEIEDGLLIHVSVHSFG
jgi:hypothetical protein